MSTEPNQSKLEEGFGKLHAFCSTHSLFKTDEELRNSFDHFLVRSDLGSVKADKERLQKDYKALEELLPVLVELAEELIAERNQQKGKDLTEDDFRNRQHEK